MPNGRHGYIYKGLTYLYLDGNTDRAWQVLNEAANTVAPTALAVERYELSLLDRDGAKLMHRAGDIIFEITILRGNSESGLGHILRSEMGCVPKSGIAQYRQAGFSLNIPAPQKGGGHGLKFIGT